MIRRRRRTVHTELAVSDDLLAAVRSLSRPLRSSADLDPLLERIGEARYVLLGEASHGTHEFYTWRAEISRRLIEEKGFTFIAVEGDWPDCYRVTRYAKGDSGSGENAYDVLHDFDRWPTWMWANREIVEFVEWLRRHNDGLPEQKRCGFYGLDVYSLWDSLYQVLGYLGKHDGSAVPAARRVFGCFEPYGEDAQEYARATRWVDASCEDEVVALLAEMRGSARGDLDDGWEEHFNAEQNVLIVRNAEHYYRTMIQGGPESWNIRDRHMYETLERLMRNHEPNAKAVVWEHNTHIGDARFTDMADDGMYNVGQLARERNSERDVVLIGFSSHRGSVIAGREWEAPMEEMEVPPARPGSWEDLLHRACGDDRLLLLDEMRRNERFLDERGHRAIGVVYRPEYERYGNYVPTVLPRRYDALLHIERSHALRPFHLSTESRREVAETYPTGL